MSVKEINDMFHCDCGLSWRRGTSGHHYCEDGLRAKLAAVVAENATLKQKGREVLNEACKVYEKFNETINQETGDFMDGQTLHEFQFLLDGETPATDACLAEVRVKACNALVDELEAMFKRMSNNPDFAPEHRSGAAGAAAVVGTYRREVSQ